MNTYIILDTRWFKTNLVVEQTEEAEQSVGDAQILNMHNIYVTEIIKTIHV